MPLRKFIGKLDDVEIGSGRLVEGQCEMTAFDGDVRMGGGGRIGSERRSEGEGQGQCDYQAEDAHEERCRLQATPTQR